MVIRISTLMKKLLQKLFGIDLVRIQNVTNSNLTIAQWQKQESLVTDMRALERNQTFKMAMDVLRNSHPKSIVLQLGTSPNDRVVHQARIEGYEYCLNNLAALSQVPKQTKAIEATFQPVK